MDVSGKLQGLDGALANIAAIKYDMRRKGGRFALRKAAQVFVKAIQQNASRLDDSATGRTIAKNVVERWNGRLNKANGDLGFRIGVTQGALLPKKGEKPNEAAGGPTPHWRLLEFGTEKMAAQPFFVPAIAPNIGLAVDTFVAYYEKKLASLIKAQARS